MARPLVIGVGQPWRGDDAAGLDALALLEAADGLDADLRPHHGEGLGLIALWEARELVIVLDAAQSGAPPGTLHRMEAGTEALDARCMRTSSHVFGVHDAVQTARALGRMPGRLVLLAVEGAQWTLGEPLSPPVKAALPALVEAVTAELAAGRAKSGPTGL